MGEVYRARDPRIGREVAVKVLPARFASDPGALRRFEQEARAAGVLNHPNVLAVYDVGAENGTHYVVSELLEGESLRDRLDHGPIPPRKAIAYALEMLRGLAAAHEKGIVHRDIKPANIFITRDDRVKILDFGLAKLLEPAAADPDATRAMGPTTNPGLIMGSAGYMSPEQVKGIPTDHRSDIFSAGVVIYEMLSGQQAFRGDSAVECMNAILKEDPAPLLGMPALDGVIRHCLEKQPELRFQSARDLAFALEAAGSGMSSSASAVPASALAKPPRRVPWKPIAAAVLFAGAIAAAYMLGARANRPTQPEYHRLGLYHGESLMGVVRHRFAPDGKTIVISGHHGITFTRVDNPAVRSLNLHDYSLLSVSSAGDLALLRDGVVSSVPFSGGAPRPLVENATDADWSPDGRSLAVIRRTGSTSVLEYPVGQVLYQTTNGLGSLRVSPRGDAVALFEFAAGNRSVVLLKAGAERRVLSTGWSFVSRLAWTPDGREIWFSAARSGSDFPIWAVDLSGHERLIDRVPGRLHVDDIAKDGHVLAELGFARAGIDFRGPADTADRDLSWLDASQLVAISADGSHVLFSESGEAAGDRPLVYLRDTSGADAIRLGEGAAIGFSPDGKSVLVRTPENQFGILPVGAGQPRIIAPPGRPYDAAAMLPDGRMLCWAQESGHGARIYVRNTAGVWKANPEEFADNRGSMQMVLSPGADRVAVRNGSHLLVFTAATGELRAIEHWPESGNIAGWTADGQSLYVSQAMGERLDIGRFSLATQKVEPWKRIDVPRAMPTWARVTPDGRSYAYVYQVTSTDAFVISGLR
jgi:serine/threonine protein kinase